MGFGKTNFSKSIFSLFSDENLNIAFIQTFNIIILLIFGEYYFNNSFQDLFMETVSIEQLEIFSRQKRIINRNLDQNLSIKKNNKNNLNYRNLIKKNLNFLFIVSTLTPIIIIFSIMIADVSLKYDSSYLSKSPTFFIIAFVLIFFISDFLFLREIHPTIRSYEKILNFPKFYFFIYPVISTLIILLSIINLGLI
jgi:sterol desaturase/sphingolipid hydroxylase (fatty acid hydroxylase superfamily)